MMKIVFTREVSETLMLFKMNTKKNLNYVKLTFRMDLSKVSCSFFLDETGCSSILVWNVAAKFYVIIGILI